MKDCCLSTKSDKECIRKNDKKTFKLPRRFSKERCKKGIKGFTMRSSCAPYKGCNKKGGSIKCKNKNPLTENKDTYYRICHNNTRLAEKRYSGKYNTSYINKKGYFICSCCSNKLYKTSDMYDSKTGWPAFKKPFNNKSIKYNSKTSELTCHSCGLHLGHRTFDGPLPTKIHDCINSVCLHFIELKGGSKKYKSKQKNMNKKTLKICSKKPLTGYNRSGYCETDMFDMGSHLVCAKMNKKFLKYTKSMGNDLSTPSSSFPGLKPGDKWCLCQDRWNEAFNNGIKTKVIKNATNLSIKDEVRKNINKKGGAKSNKKQFLYNPDNPKKSFDVYIDKDPSDTIPIKYKTIQDVKNTIRKLEKLYKSNKYPHKRIWQVGMIMYVRLKVLKQKKPKEFKLSEKYFKFLGQRTKIKDEKGRKGLTFKF